MEVSYWIFCRAQAPSGRHKEKKIKSNQSSILRSQTQMIKAKNVIELLGLPLAVEEIKIYWKLLRQPYLSKSMKLFNIHPVFEHSRGNVRMSNNLVIFAALIAFLHFQMTAIHSTKSHPTEFPALHLFFTIFSSWLIL